MKPFRETLYVSTVEKPERLIVVMATALAVMSCAPKGATLAASGADLTPEASPGATATLRLGASPPPKGGVAPAEFEVALRQSRKGATVTLELLTGGEAIEKEVYEVGEGAFRVAWAGDEAFRPALDLLRYPVHAGDAWSWKGQVAYAGASREARADIALKRDGEETRSDVTLFVAADAGRPELKRSLTFWFRRGQGVSRRQFGDVSARFPTGQAWQP